MRMRTTMFGAAAIVALTLAGLARAEMVYKDAVLADNPRFYWTFDDADMQPETKKAINQGGAGGGLLAGQAQATTIASTTNAGGLSLGKAASFNGLSGHWWYSAPTAGSPGTDLADTANTQYSSYAIEFWAKLTNNDAQVISQSGEYVGGSYHNPRPAVLTGYYDLPAGQTSLELYGGDGGGGRTGSDFPNIALDEWHHFVMAYEGIDDGQDVQTFIIDGDYAGRTTSTGMEGGYFHANDARLILGSWLNGNQRLANGTMIDEYAVYDLEGLDSTAFQSKLQSLAGHYTVPEPTSVALLLAGLLGLAIVRRRK